ncbi:endonuclease/exonuclease/phosphatase family protein [Branchiibius sp. NY16-3462-2]|uniref:endonuclease/exonuclease/phosphatase family protein n=1 Tax=Branchiibius sp. NY16-3462-2 TaxID=1807500 RepID=UPI00079882E3|nr:endonuclease/exonuclease/phosphatase family protein [Branchiibius sp. NY16-3462-2]KYH45472.1 hypothetical protein AZH51_00740 [Branchiibius sp. NY16-3462-2]
MKVAVRSAITALGWLVLALTAGALATRWLDTTRWHLPVVQSAFPIAGCVAVALALTALVAAAVTRRCRFAVAACVVALLPLALAAGAVRSDTIAAADSDEILMFSNMRAGGADPATLIHLVNEHHVDTLVLAEVTADGLAGLDRAGLSALLPHREGRTAYPYAGTMVLSRHPLTLRGLGVDGAGFYQPIVTVEASHSYLLHAVHTYAPIGRNTPLWREQLATLQRWRQAQPTTETIVMAGDFNASSAMPGFRGIADTMTDSLRATGAGWVRTWPNESRIPPFIQLDHILVRVPGKPSPVVASGVDQVGGTDHYAVWARLSVAPGTIGS